MEHNGYAVWKVKIKCRREMREQIDRDDSRHMGYTDALIESYTIVAPCGDLGKALIKVHFAENISWKFGALKPLDDGQRLHILEMKEERLHTVIRFDDEYRGRM